MKAVKAERGKRTDRSDSVENCRATTTGANAILLSVSSRSLRSMQIVASSVRSKSITYPCLATLSISRFDLRLNPPFPTMTPQPGMSPAAQGAPI